MAKGPSPLVPLLLVFTLGLLLHGQLFMNSFSFAIDTDDTTFTYFIIFPLLAILLVYYTTQSIIVPLVVILLTYTVSKILLGPLFLIVIIYFATVYATSLQGYGYDYQQNRGAYSGARDGDEFGGCGWLFLVLMVFLALQVLFSKTEGNEWGLVVLGVLFFFLFNSFSD